MLDLRSIPVSEKLFFVGIRHISNVNSNSDYYIKKLFLFLFCYCYYFYYFIFLLLFFFKEWSWPYLFISSAMFKRYNFAFLSKTDCT